MAEAAAEEAATARRKDQNYALRMNRRGLKPQHLRHVLKAEDSVESSEEGEDEFGQDGWGGDEGMADDGECTTRSSEIAVGKHSQMIDDLI